MVFLLLLCLGKIHVIENICKLPIKLTKNTIVVGLMLIFRKILTSNTNFCIHFNNKICLLLFYYYYFIIIIIILLLLLFYYYYYYYYFIIISPL